MKTRFFIIVLALVAVTLLVAGCGTAADSPETAEVANLANPAAVFCQDQGGTVIMRQTNEGQYGVCIFADGSECEEWALYRGECVPAIGLANRAAAYCETQGGTTVMRHNNEGEFGVCVFTDGSECAEWAFYRGECAAASDTGVPSGVVMARDSAIAYIQTNYGDVLPAGEMNWQVSYNEPDASANGGFRFLAQTCAVEVAYTVTAPDAVAYQIRLSDSGSNFDWQGVVNAQGEVTEGS